MYNICYFNLKLYRKYLGKRTDYTSEICRLLKFKNNIRPCEFEKKIKNSRNRNHLMSKTFGFECVV